MVPKLCLRWELSLMKSFRTLSSGTDISSLWCTWRMTTLFSLTLSCSAHYYIALKMQANHGIHGSYHWYQNPWPWMTMNGVLTAVSRCLCSRWDFCILRGWNVIRALCPQRIGLHETVTSILASVWGHHVQETHQEMRWRTWTFLMTTSYTYYKIQWTPA